MTTTTPTNVTTQVYRVYIRATPEAIWEAITTSDWTERYGYGGRVEYDLRPGGRYRALATDAMRAAGAPEVMVDGDVIECDPPRRLVQTWRLDMGAHPSSEGYTRLTYEIDETGGGVSRLTVIHDLDGAPTMALFVSGAQEDTGAGGGWNWVLSGLKTVLETGRSLTASA